MRNFFFVFHVLISRIVRFLTDFLNRRKLLLFFGYLKSFKQYPFRNNFKRLHPLQRSYDEGSHLPSRYMRVLHILYRLTQTRREASTMGVGVIP